MNWRIFLIHYFCLGAWLIFLWCILQAVLIGRSDGRVWIYFNLWGEMYFELVLIPCVIIFIIVSMVISIQKKTK